MYIWIGCRLPHSLETGIRQACGKDGWAEVLDFSGFSLPQHISLKISFEAGEAYPRVLERVEALLRCQEKFYVNPNRIEQAGSILWLTFHGCAELSRLHQLLDRELEREFGIGQHSYDREFLFHSTVCFGPAERVREFSRELEDFPVPEELEIDTFLLGISESGKAGTYRVVREIKV